jgi:hypothetical protein
VLVFVSDEVLIVEVVSVAGHVSALVLLVSVCSGGGDVRARFGIGGVALPRVSVVTGALICDPLRTGVWARVVVAGGSVVAIVPPVVSLPIGFGFVGSVKFVVVSTFVLVSGAGVSPGALMVDVTPLADPSSTVWYCC